MAKENKIRVRLVAYDHKILDLAVEKILEVAKNTGATFKYKDSREQFEIRTHKRLIYITNPTKETVELLRRLDLPSGVDIDVKL